MSHISSASTTGVAARYAVQLRELLALLQSTAAASAKQPALSLSPPRSPDRAANEVLPVVATAAGSST